MISIICSWRSARLSAELMKVATSLDADFRRMLERPLVAPGRVMPTNRPMIARTTMSSIRVTPRREQAKGLLHKLFPTDDVRIFAFSSGLAVEAVGDDVRLVPVLSGELVDIGMSPGIQRNFFRQIGAVPVGHVARLQAEGRQPLVGGRECSDIELVSAHRGAERFDLAPGRYDFT